ncbi:MAG: hypothetical protein WAK19_11380 [Candidatus Cybelea sp.]
MLLATTPAKIAATTTRSCPLIRAEDAAGLAFACKAPAVAKRLPSMATILAH